MIMGRETKIIISYHDMMILRMMVAMVGNREKDYAYNKKLVLLSMA
jgi:hypothetical protein